MAGRSASGACCAWCVEWMMSEGAAWPRAPATEWTQAQAWQSIRWRLEEKPCWWRAPAERASRKKIAVVARATRLICARHPRAGRRRERKEAGTIRTVRLPHVAATRLPGEGVAVNPLPDPVAPWSAYRPGTPDPLSVDLRTRRTAIEVVPGTRRFTPREIPPRRAIP